jgi:hypothetical protein
VDIPFGVVTAPANRHDSPLLDETLDHVLGTLRELPDGASVDLDRSYDSLTTRRKLEACSLIGEISQKGKPVPVSATKP